MASAWGKAWASAWGHSWGGNVVNGVIGSGFRPPSVSPAYAKKLIEAKLRAIAKYETKPKRQKEKRQEVAHAAVAIDDIAKQSKEISKLERDALVNIAVQEVISMQTRLDAEIKAEFAAIQIASQLALFEEEIIFMFMTATEA